MEIVDVLYRFATGIDDNDTALLGSAFTPDAVLDFSPYARKMGLDLPRLEGRARITSFLGTNAGPQTTTHVVTNPRAMVEGNRAHLRALVEATHLPPQDHTRRCQMKNRYEAELLRDGARWRIRRLTIDNAWFEGDPAVLLGE